MDAMGGVMETAEFVVLLLMSGDDDAAVTTGTLTRKSVSAAVLSEAVLPLTWMDKYLAATGGKP